MPRFRKYRKKRRQPPREPTAMEWANPQGSSAVRNYLDWQERDQAKRKRRQARRRRRQMRKCAKWVFLLVLALVVVVGVFVYLDSQDANEPDQGVVTAPSTDPTPTPRATAGSRSATPVPTVMAPTPIATSTVGMPAPPTPTATLKTPTVLPVPTTALPTPTAIPTPTVPPTPTAIPTPTPVVHPSERYLGEKLYMLELINTERVGAGRTPVVLGNNVSAQLHAEDALAGCYSGHWGSDGLKPYMRYSLAGGYQSNGENGLGWDYCIKFSDGYAALRPIKTEIREAMDTWMDSSGHRDNILDPWHKKVNIGLAWDRYNVMMFQHFEGAYVRFEQLPTITSGILTIKGKTINGATQQAIRDMTVSIYYDPPPYELTRGQLARTYCYDSGLNVASLREPLTGGWTWTNLSHTTTDQPCPNPYDVDPDARPPMSVQQADNFWWQAYRASIAVRFRTVTVPWITADRWTLSGDHFEIRANIASVLNKHGPGVYSLIVWGKADGEDFILSEYSLFHNVTPPDTYQQAGG